MNLEKKETTARMMNMQVSLNPDLELNLKSTSKPDKPYLSEVLTLALVGQNLKIPQVIRDVLVLQHPNTSQMISEEIENYNQNSQRMTVYGLNGLLCSLFWRGETGKRRDAIIFQIRIKQLVQDMYGGMRKDDLIEKKVNMLLGVGSIEDVEML